MRVRRVAGCLALFAWLAPAAARSTTAPSLRDRISIDGWLDEYAPDEWVLDATSPFAESEADSRWGADRELLRVAVTWDAEFLYLGIEFRSRGELAALYLANAAGGLTGLDGAGSFRRAIDLPALQPNVLALAAPGSVPDVALVDASHPLGLLDRATAPAVVRSTIDGRAAFELALPWERLSVARAVHLVCALTGEIGTGCGDAAPDARVDPSIDRFARSRLDRALVITADADANGTPDAGVSPRSIAAVETPGPSLAGGSEALRARTDVRTFAPDRAESVIFTVAPESGGFSDVAGRCGIYAVDGRLVREFGVALAGPAAQATVAWDGRDGRGHIVPGGVFVAAFELEFSAGAARSRSRATAGVAVVR